MHRGGKRRTIADEKCGDANSPIYLSRCDLRASEDVQDVDSKRAIGAFPTHTLTLFAFSGTKMRNLNRITPRVDLISVFFFCSAGESLADRAQPGDKQVNK